MGVVLTGDSNDWCLWRKQGQWPVLQLTGRVSFGVEIRDFFQLQGTFECNWVAQIAADKEERAALCQRAGQLGDGGAVLEHLSDIVWQPP